MGQSQTQTASRRDPSLSASPALPHCIFLETAQVSSWLKTHHVNPLAIVSFGSPVPETFPCPVIHLDLPELSLARGLMARPKLLMLDEPSLGLAPIIVQQLFGVLREIRKQGMTILLVEQNAHMALSVADRGYVLETGNLMVEGSPSDLLDNEEVRAAYLGGTEPVAPVLSH